MALYVTAILVRIGLGHLLRKTTLINRAKAYMRFSQGKIPAFQRIAFKNLDTS